MTDTVLRVGRAKVDITGEPWGAGMMGYGVPKQRTSGLATRQWARAFVFETGPEHSGEGGPRRRVALVVADIGMFFDAAVECIGERVEIATGGALTADDLVLTATHTHCGPGGYGRHRLYNLTTLGFHRRTFERLTDGVASAIVEAFADLAPAELYLARGELRNASINRSPTSFDRNDDRDRFPERIDPAVTVFGVERNGVPIAAVEWFAVHCTSMTNTNRLISSDNKGWAAAQWERTDPGLVAAFAQTNSGDMSPNLDGSAGRGPTDDEHRNTAEIGRRQLAAARAALAGPRVRQPARLDYRLRYVDLGKCPESSDPAAPASGTSPAVLGAAFAAGTDDGVGSPLFRQGLGNRVGAVSRLLYRRFPRLRAAQAPKEMLLPVGALGWVAERLPVRVLQIGSLYLVCLPMEVTVTAGARIRDVVADTLGVSAHEVLVQGYTGGYAHYLTTPEEYDAQRYEAASTLFGRNQLAAVIAVATGLAQDLRAGRPTDPGPAPRTRASRAIGSPLGAAWAARGRTARPSAPTSVLGERVTATFGCEHPNLAIAPSYLRVERLVSGSWQPIADDDSPSTRISWRRTPRGFESTVEFVAKADGRYRIGYRESHAPDRYVFAEPVDVQGHRPGANDPGGAESASAAVPGAAL